MKFIINDGATATVELIGGSSSPVTINKDSKWVGRITDSITGIKVTVTESGREHYEIYSLSNIVLE